MKKVAVIGGGIVGISATHFLEENLKDRNDIEIKLFEKSKSLGGVIKTTLREGFVIEGGPDCFIADKPSPIRMAEKLGFDNDLINTLEENKSTYVYSKGKLHLLPDGIMMMVPTKFWPFVTTSLFSWAGKLRMGMDLFIPPRKNNDDESLASFVRRRLGKEALDKLAEPLVAGIHGSDPETMSLRATFPRFLEMEEKYGSLIKGFVASRKKVKEFQKKLEESGKPKRTFFVSFKYGMQELTDKMVASLKRTQLCLGAEVTSISKIEKGFELHFADGKKEFFDAVVVTVPAYAASKIVRDIDTRLSALLSKIPYSSSATVNLAFKTEDLRMSLKGFGFVVPSSEKMRVLAGTWSSLKWPYRAPKGYTLMRAFIGGARNSELVELEEDELVRIALEDISKIMKIEARPVFTEVFRFPKSMPQYTLGHLERVHEIEKLAGAYENFSLVGSYFNGVGIGDCINQGKKGSEKILKNL